VAAAPLTAREQIGVSPFPEAPPGTTPNALSVSPDGRTLAVANADNNTIAMIDIAQPGRSEVAGFIPTGWYPTSVLFDHTGRKLFVLSGKGLIGQANPRGPNVSPMNNGQYAGELLQGTVSVVDVTPNAHALARQFVLLDNFYVDAEVSYDGHAFSTGAYATDVVEKLWPTNYGHRGGVYLSEGGYGDRNPYGNLSAPSDGYIW